MEAVHPRPAAGPLGAVLGLGATTAACIGYLAVAPGSAATVTAANDIFQTAIPLCVAAPVLGRAAWRSTGRQRWAWGLLMGSALSWGLGQAVWSWSRLVAGIELPYPGPADVGFLGALPLLLAGVLVFPSTGLRTIGRARAVLDGLLITAGLFFAAYGSFLGVVHASSDQSLRAWLLAMVYPMSDLVIVAVVLAVLARREDRFTGPLPLVAAGVISLTVADSAFAYLAAGGLYVNDPVTDVGWPLGFGLIALAGYLSPVETGGDEAVSSASLRGVAIPTAPVVLAVVVLVHRLMVGSPVDTALGVTGAAIGVLLVARLVVTMLENRELTHHLEQSVSELRAREGDLQFQALHDPLTLLANRALFRDRLSHALDQRRTDAVAVLFIDIDDFKTVNDSLGHDAGDHLLAAVGERLRACIRVGDTAARIGGDEFAVLLEGTQAVSDGALLAQRVLAALEVPFSLMDRELRVSVSIGMATARHGSGEGVLQDADLAMYAAKAKGKGRLELFHNSMRTVAIDRLDLVAEVHQAAEAGQLRVHLQPTVDLRTLQVTGHEALVRWQHPQRGLLGPQTFLAVAEETGAIVPIGWWVLEQACAQAHTWESGEISVNLAARQVTDPTTPSTVADILARTGIDPGRVVLEITESVLLDPEAITGQLLALRSMGLKIAIDDFGTGYSSLSYLSRLPVDILKIDRSFIERLGGPLGDEVLVRSVVQLAEGLGLRSVGEGVETELQLHRLQSFGCDSAQGYLFGRPQPEPRFEIEPLEGLRPVTNLASRRSGRS